VTPAGRSSDYLAAACRAGVTLEVHRKSYLDPDDAGDKVRIAKLELVVNKIAIQVTSRVHFYHTCDVERTHWRRLASLAKGGQYKYWSALAKIPALVDHYGHDWPLEVLRRLEVRPTQTMKDELYHVHNAKRASSVHEKTPAARMRRAQNKNLQRAVRAIEKSIAAETGHSYDGRSGLDDDANAKLKTTVPFQQPPKRNAAAKAKTTNKPAKSAGGGAPRRRGGGRVSQAQLGLRLEAGEQMNRCGACELLYVKKHKCKAAAVEEKQQK
jgi:hypothetical protein